MNALLAESLLQTHCFSHAAIIKRKDLVIKARTPDWPIQREELDKVVTLFDHPTVAREQGMSVGGCPYRVVRADQMSIYGKVDEDAMNTLKTLGMAPSGLLGQKDQQLVGTTVGGGNLTVNLGNAANLKASGVQLGGQGSPGQVPASPGAVGQDPGPERPSEKDKTIVEVIRPPLSSSLSSKRHDGIIVCRTGMYLLVGVYDRHPGMAVEAMERLADWFRSKHR